MRRGGGVPSSPVKTLGKALSIYQEMMGRRWDAPSIFSSIRRKPVYFDELQALFESGNKADHALKATEGEVAEILVGLETVDVKAEIEAGATKILSVIEKATPELVGHVKFPLVLKIVELHCRVVLNKMPLTDCIQQARALSSQISSELKSDENQQGYAAMISGVFSSFNKDYKFSLDLYSLLSNITSVVSEKIQTVSRVENEETEVLRLSLEEVSKEVQRKQEKIERLSTQAAEQERAHQKELSVMRDDMDSLTVAFRGKIQKLEKQARITEANYKGEMRGLRTDIKKIQKDHREAFADIVPAQNLLMPNNSGVHVSQIRSTL